ncbi:TetR/AcrR family transcriptional regulator [Sphingomonas sp. CGMCC 1.13654]|uniref:TetR/AcrR family transcriptional regulator n=1 Tax=Sphingomonas chungangi TaxID=2683589 RepID=A0A838L407_9SPHN|nr:TetR/AcrR family transcriptional regulator [Sphingomonas chungangi]MBA2933904.1 TetR/AcrR family transcriptional regulator [Sphingomonas chungangi]MVW55233.1 TetR family transcriptional regulator [Sphingomonas chungangi]
MGISERKIREKSEREGRIIATARRIAEEEGWEAVTIRRLAQDIEYSQPVVYSHFASRDAIVGAVALEGFGDMADALRAAAPESLSPREALEAVVTAFLDFAFGRPAIYEAMFVLPSGLRFARSDTPPQLRNTFGALMAAIAPFCRDAELATETFWAALHGLVELERHGRIRPAFRASRLSLVVEAICHTPDGGT